MVAPTFLQLNLTSRTFEVKSYPDLIPLVGGLGWALALSEQFFEEEPIVLAGGPLSAVFPGASKTAAVFRSPQTGFLATSFAGGNLARFLRAAGYQGIVILGRASSPTMVTVAEDKIEFSDASRFLGLETPKVFELVSSSAGVPGKQSVLTTGPAAEQGIGYSPLYLDEFFSFPRGGLGRAWAQKNLKVLTIAGEKGESFEDDRRYQEVFGSLYRKLQGHRELSELGTLRNLAVEKKIAAVPVNNLAESNLPGEELLAPAFAEAGTARRVSCGGCPVGCIHLFKGDQRFTPYDYESVVALGPLLGIFDPRRIAALIERAWGLGMDPVCLGTVLAYLTEKEGLDFGNEETYLTLIKALFAGREQWARDLRESVPTNSQSLGIAGLGLLPYFNGYASVLSQVLQLGATTEENRGFLLDLDLIEKEIEPAGLVRRLVEAQYSKTAAEALVGCGYLASVFEDPATSFAALQALGSDFSHEHLQKTAQDIFRKKLALQQRTGFRPADVKIPEKLSKIPSPQGILERKKLEEMIRIYEEEIYDKVP
jgi:aldehyde:ferredoxin oxidoreductase